MSVNDPTGGAETVTQAAEGTDDAGEASFPWTAEAEELMEEWRLRAWAAQIAHYRIGSRLRSYNIWLGLPVVVFTTVVGTSLFATLDEQQSTEIRIVIGSISVAAAILAGVQTFLNFAARATQHVLAADWYASIRRRIEQEMHIEEASGRPQEVHGRDPQGDEHRGFAVPRSASGCGPRWPRSSVSGMKAMTTPPGRHRGG